MKKRHDYKKITGIYGILSTVNNKFYIGKAKNILNRWFGGHYGKFMRKAHDNRHLQNHFNKYGNDGFSLIIIEECSEAELTEREDYYITKYNATVDGFNIDQEGINRDAREYIFKNFVTGEIAKGVNVSKFAKNHDLNARSLLLLLYGRIARHENWICPKFNFEPVPHELVSPYGILHKFYSIKNFCIENGLKHSNVSKVLNGERAFTKGWGRPDSIKVEIGNPKTFYFYDPSGVQIKVESLTKHCEVNSLNYESMVALGLGTIKYHRGWAKYREYCGSYQEDTRPYFILRNITTQENVKFASFFQVRKLLKLGGSAHQKIKQLVAGKISQLKNWIMVEYKQSGNPDYNYFLSESVING